MKGWMVIFATVALGQANAQKPMTVSAQLTNANVYYGYGAELNHIAKATLQAGAQEVIVDGLSIAPDERTIQIAVPENVVLLSYRFALKARVLDAPDPILKQIKDSIRLISKSISAANNEYSITSDMLNKTSKLIESYSASPGKSTTVDLVRLLDLYTSKVQLYRTQMYTIQLKKEELATILDELNTRSAQVARENEGKQTKYTGQMVLQLMAQQASTADITLSYFTQRAGWLPTYDMRVKTIDNTFRLVYKASLNQSTGIDWKQVKLTLSTNNPNQGNIYPVVTPLILQLYNPEMYRETRSRAAAAVYNRAQSMKKMEVSDAVTSAYGVARGEESASDVGDYLTLNEGQLNTSFEIAIPYDIPSDGKTYSVAIKEEKLTAMYKHYAVPRMDKDAFLLAEISDWESLDLLPGDANIIMDNVYLGKSFIDPNTTTDTLNISLGRDKRVAIKRQLVKEFSKTKVKGDTRTETISWEITVKNNKSKDVAMLLKDQFPISKLKEVQVKLDEASGAEINEELGTLNWKVDLKAGETKKFRFSYTVTYPKDQKIANLR